VSTLERLRDVARTGDKDNLPLIICDHPQRQRIIALIELQVTRAESLLLDLPDSSLRREMLFSVRTYADAALEVI
jgi:hypothetical protein